MLFGGRYVAKKEEFSAVKMSELGGSGLPKNTGNLGSNATPYPYPTQKASKTTPAFRVNSVLRSLNVNPDPLLHSKTPMELHRARVRITENEIGHSLNEASKKFFGKAFPLPIKNNKSIIPHSPRTKISFISDDNNENEDEIEEAGGGNRRNGSLSNTSSKSSKPRVYSVHKESYPAVVLLKTSPIAPLRLRSPRPLPKYQRRPLEPPRLEDLNVINGFTHINTDGRREKNTFATTAPKKHHRGDRERDTSRVGRFHAEIDLGGFLENEIFFQTDDSSLLVIGLREKRDGLNARKVTEVLEFPEGVYPESLCISRTANGTLILEQHF